VPDTGSFRALQMPVAATEKAVRDHPAAGRRAPLAAVVDPLLLSADQAAALCGVSLATWYRMVSAGRTPAPVRLSRGCVRYSREAIVEWIQQGCPDRKTFESRQAAQNAAGRPRQAAR
jgi:excisionase family DNA binding protein